MILAMDKKGKYHIYSSRKRVPEDQGVLRDDIINVASTYMTQDGHLVDDIISHTVILDEEREYRRKNGMARVRNG